MIELSTIAPDFDDLVTQFTTQMQSKPTWTDRLTSSTGQTLVEFFAAMGAYSQYSIESGFQESYPETAKNNNSLYAAANYLGVRYPRKMPASVKVMMRSPSPMTVPINSQFNGAGTYWFNRNALNLTSTPTEVTLHQGQVKTTQTFGLSTDFQGFISPEKDFVVSDVDVFLKIDSVSVPAIREGLWTKPQLPGAQHFTLPSGQMILLFGNADYGSRPSTTDLCEITYVITLGADGANVPTIDKQFSLDGNPDVNGRGTSQATGGGSQANPLVYKNVTPALFGSFNASVTPAQYKRLPLQYPGVIDAQTFAQREVNPRALTLMNVIKVSLLTQTVWSSGDWDAFEAWFNENAMYAPRIFREDPLPAPVSTSGNIRCKNLANLGEVQINVEAALDRLFAKRQGIIGLDIYKSDIINAILDADSNIDHVQLLTPANDVILSSLNAPRPVLTVHPTGGTLGPGLYDYALSLVSTLGGETAPSFWATVNIASGTTNRIVLTWENMPNVVNWKVWGRQTPAPMGWIATLGAATLTFNDTGSIAPLGTVPVQSTIGSYYPSLIAKSFTYGYTNRDTITY